MNDTGLGVYSRNMINSVCANYSNNNYFLFTPKINEHLLVQIDGDFQIILPSKKIDRILTAFWRTFNSINQIRDLRLDVYHGLSNELPYGIHKIKGLRKIVTIHDLIFMKEKSQYPLIDRVIYENKIRYACRVADKIIAISEQTKADLIELIGVDEKKIEVVYQCCDVIFNKRYSQDEQSKIKVKYALPENFILNVSAFFPRKNQMLLIKAFELIQQQIPHHLILVGGYEMERQKIENYLSEKNLATRVHILSALPKADLSALYQMASLFVYPSQFEGFGIPILEAMASGIQVIANEIKCFREIGGDAITYFKDNSANDLAKKIKFCISESKQNTEALNQRVALFSAKSFAKAIFQLYR